MSNLIVECPNGHKKDSPKAIIGIVRLVKEHLLGFGINEGKWSVNLIKKTGGGGQDRIVFKSIYEDSKKPSIVFFVRPFDRDSSWLIETYPPPCISVAELKAKFEGKKEEPVSEVQQEPKEEPKEETQEKSQNIITNQIGKAKVIKILDGEKLGIEIEVKVGFGGREKKYNSFLSLDDIREGEYDKKELTRWPPGKTFKVLVLEVDEEAGTAECSSHTDGYSSSKNLDDRFSGSLNADGTIILTGFCDDSLRILGLVRWMSEKVSDRTLPLNSKTMQEICQSYFDAKYGNGEHIKFFPKQLPNIIRGLTGGNNPLLEGNVKSGYLVTEAGWNEFDALKRMAKGEVVSSPIVEIPIEEVAAVVEEPEPIFEATPLLKEINNVNAIEYHDKEMKLAAIEENIKAEEERLGLLAIEKEELLEYLETNKLLKEKFDELIESVTSPEVAKPL
jgi:hypothetical protein